MIVELTEEAYSVLCGLVQPSEQVNADGIIASEPAWNELRESFPLDAFESAVRGRVITYEADAGQ